MEIKITNLQDVSLFDHEQPLTLLDYIKNTKKIYPSPTLNKEYNHQILDSVKFHTFWDKIKFLLSLTFSILVYVCDVLSDFIVAFYFAYHGDYLQCFFTLLFIYISSFITTHVSVLWYARYKVYNNSENRTSINNYENLWQPINFLHARCIKHKNKIISWKYRLIVFLFNVTPLGSYLYVLKVALVKTFSKNDKKCFCCYQACENDQPSRPALPDNNDEVTLYDFNKQLVIDGMKSNVDKFSLRKEDEPSLYKYSQCNEDDDFKQILLIKFHADYERLYQCFFESIPQTVLQSTLFFIAPFFETNISEKDAWRWFHCASICISILGIAVSIYSYHKNISTKTFKKNGSNYDKTTGYLLWIKCLWHFLYIASRITLFFALFTFCSLIDYGSKDMLWPIAIPTTLFLLQWIVFCIYLNNHGRESCLIHAANSWMFVWVAISSDNGRTKKFYLLYYLFDLIILLSLLVFFTISLEFLWQIIPTTLAIVCLITLGVSSFTFILATILKVTYYVNYKPENV